MLLTFLVVLRTHGSCQMMQKRVTWHPGLFFHAFMERKTASDALLHRLAAPSQKEHPLSKPHRTLSLQAHTQTVQRWQGSGRADSSRSTLTAASAASVRASPLGSSPRILARPRAFAARATCMVPAASTVSAWNSIAAASSRALRAGQSVRSRALKATHARIASSPHSA